MDEPLGKYAIRVIQLISNEQELDMLTEEELHWATMDFNIYLKEHGVTIHLDMTDEVAEMEYPPGHPQLRACWFGYQICLSELITNKRGLTCQ